MKHPHFHNEKSSQPSLYVCALQQIQKHFITSHLQQYDDVLCKMGHRLLPLAPFSRQLETDVGFQGFEFYFSELHHWNDLNTQFSSNHQLISVLLRLFDGSLKAISGFHAMICYAMLCYATLCKSHYSTSPHNIFQGCLPCSPSHSSTKCQGYCITVLLGENSS